MPFYNTYPGFLYRQFFICPSAAPSSLSLNECTGMVTGANSGLGYHACHQLLNRGLSRLILAVRSVSKGEAARKRLLESIPTSSKPPIVEIWEIDLANYASITAFVKRLKQSGIVLNFAILNAGIACFSFGLNSSTGHEESIQINWLSTALLTLLLIPVLDEQAGAHLDRPRPVISIVGSETAAWARFKEAELSSKQQISLLKALDDKNNFNMTDRYYTSKLLYQLFFLELVCNHRSGALRSSGAVLNLVNPGFCYGSELHRSAKGALGKGLGAVKRVVGRPVSMGARTLVHGAVIAGPESNGKYLSDNCVAPFAGYGDTSAGGITQGKVWEETMTELSKVADMTKLMSEI